ncbi:uncharacterized protein LOC125677051 isoform X4 [Ostrea edulis]|uniref:uncharacterized protein LOC125677051 isoform X4 n=1 Tax=Ostrea edulis TaxID=37623 RepID=UPI0024AF7032|nr:uncharacterized protein LOC125677051 isoform X4 [Ostrea edulis]
MACVNALVNLIHVLLICIPAFGSIQDLEPNSSQKNDSQCYGTVAPNTIYMQCDPNYTLVPKSLTVGTKKNSTCLSVVRNSTVSRNITYHNICCTHNESENCVLNHQDEDYTKLWKYIGLKASGYQNAFTEVAQIPHLICTDGYLENSTYNTVEYYCIPDSRTFLINHTFDIKNTKGETLYLQSPGYPRNTTSTGGNNHSCLVITNCTNTVTVYGLDYALSHRMRLHFKDLVSNRTLLVENDSNKYKITEIFSSDFSKLVISFHGDGGRSNGRFRVAFTASGQSDLRLLCPYSVDNFEVYDTRTTSISGGMTTTSGNTHSSSNCASAASNEFTHGRCYGWAMDVMCNDSGRIFPLLIMVGAKPDTDGCPAIMDINANSTYERSCCTYAKEACYFPYSNIDASVTNSYFKNCIGRSSCTRPVSRVDIRSYDQAVCSSAVFPDYTTFMTLHYYCIGESEVESISTSFSRNLISTLHLTAQNYSDSTPTGVTLIRDPVSCSVEVSECSGRVNITGMDVRLFSVGDVCKQTLTFIEGGRNTTIDCSNNSNFSADILYLSSSSYFTFTYSDEYGDIGGYLWLKIETVDKSHSLDINCGSTQNQTTQCHSGNETSTDAPFQSTSAAGETVSSVDHEPKGTDAAVIAVAVLLSIIVPVVVIIIIIIIIRRRYRPKLIMNMLRYGRLGPRKPMRRKSGDDRPKMKPRKKKNRIQKEMPLLLHPQKIDDGEEKEEERGDDRLKMKRRKNKNRIKKEGKTEENISTMTNSITAENGSDRRDDISERLSTDQQTIGVQENRKVNGQQLVDPATITERQNTYNTNNSFPHVRDSDAVRETGHARNNSDGSLEETQTNQSEKENTDHDTEIEDLFSSAIAQSTSSLV